MRRLRRNRLTLFGLVGIAVLAAAAATFAYFSASGAATARGSVASVNPPTSVTAQQSAGSVGITWGAASLSTGASVQGYRVKRSDGTTICGSPTLVTTLSCNDSSPVSGTTYTVTAVYHSFTASATSGSVTLLSTPTISSSPSSLSANTAPSFSFSGGGGSGFACQLDGGSFTSCSSPKAYSGLSDGSHTFKVHATSSGSIGPDATYTWTVDSSAPSITAKPASTSANTAPSFSFSHARAGYTFKCSLDNAAFATCTSAQSYSGLSAASHTFKVEAVSADSAVTTAASYTWTINTTAPSITARPASTSANANPSFSFSHAVYTAFKCKLDSGSFTSCTSPQFANGLNGNSNLSDGSHTFTVEGIDGDAVATATTAYTWTVDSSAPSITAKPSNPSASSSASFSFTHTQAGYTFQCQLDGGGYSGCTSPKSYTGLSDGSHTFQVLGVSADGATTTAASYYWVVDTTKPTDSLSLSSASGAFLNGTTLYYKGNAGGSFKLVDAVTDNGSGPASATFPAIGVTGWTHGAETVPSGTGSAPTINYTSSTFSWTASPANPSAYTVTSKDVAGNTSTGATITSFVNDTVAPTGGAVTVNGVAATAAGSSSSSSSTTFTIGSRTDYTDASSGLASSVLTVQSASLSGGTCGAAGSGGPFTNPTTITGTTQPSGIVAGACYIYTLAGIDHVGNTASVSTTVKVVLNPTVTATTPTSLATGASNQNIVITGTGFVSGSGLAASFSGTGVTVNSTTFNSSTQVTANVSVSTGATVGPRDVTVTNPDGGAGTCSSCFGVYGLSDVASNSANSGKTVSTTAFNLTAGVPYLMFVSTASAAGDSATVSFSKHWTTDPTITAIGGTEDYNGGVSHNWAWALTGGSGSGTSGNGSLTITLSNTTTQAYVEVVAVNGAMNTAAGFVATGNLGLANSGTTLSTTATAQLPGTPSNGSGEIIFWSGDANNGGSAPTVGATTPYVGAITAAYQHGGHGSEAVYGGGAGTATVNLTETSMHWGTIALEVKHS